MMSWRESVYGYCQTNGLEIFDHEQGIGIEFRDGFDAFWILPGEPLSTVPIPLEGPTDLQSVFAEFERVDGIRYQYLHCWGHHAGDQLCKLQPCSHYKFWYRSKWMERDYDIGPELTMAAMQSSSFEAYMEAALSQRGFGSSWIGKTPTQEQIRSYLEIDFFPDIPRVPPTERADSVDEDREGLLDGITIKGMLRCMRICRFINRMDSTGSMPRALRLTFKKTRAERMLRRLARKLPNVKASSELFSASVAFDLEFDDGYGEYRIRLMSKKIRDQIRSKGPRKAADAIAAEYRSINQVRKQVLNAIWNTAAQRGWVIEQNRLGASRIYLGERYREIEFDPDQKLTARARRGDAETVLRRMFADHQDFAEECVANLGSPSIRPKSGRLILRVSDQVPRELPELDQETIEALDEFSETTLAKAFKNQDMVSRFRDRFWCNPELDADWATKERWIECAQMTVIGTYLNPMSIDILVEYDHPDAMRLVKRYAESAYLEDTPHFSEARVLWLARDEFPENITQHFNDLDIETHNFMAKLGSAVSAWYIEQYGKGYGASLQYEEDEIAEWADIQDLSHELQDEMHERALKWAATTHIMSPIDCDPIRTAAVMGWTDVAEALQANPFLVPGLFDIERRPDQFDEPGIILSNDAIIAWSCLDPSEYLAKLVAFAKNTDITALADEASNRSKKHNRNVTDKDIAMSRTIYKAWYKELEVALAIAWVRCRKYI